MPDALTWAFPWVYNFYASDTGDVTAKMQGQKRLVCVRCVVMRALCTSRALRWCGNQANLLTRWLVISSDVIDDGDVTERCVHVESGQ